MGLRVAGIRCPGAGIDAILDARSAPARPLQFPAPRNRTDDPYRQAGLAGRANPADHRIPGRPSDVPAPRRNPHRDTASENRLPTDLAMARPRPRPTRTPTGPTMSALNRRDFIRQAAAAGAVLAHHEPRSTHPLRWLPATAYHIPSEFTNEESGYQSLGEGKNGRVYIGCAKYGVNAYLVEFDPKMARMRAVVDAMKSIGSTAVGFAAQAKIHSHLPVAPSGRIYFGTKQGYPKEGEKRSDYPGGYPMVYDPSTESTRVFPIPVRHQGVISHVPDERRGISFVSTCDDARPKEETRFLVLDHKSERYQDLGDMARSYAYIQRDFRGRALHLASEARVGCYDPESGKLSMLQMTVEGKRPEPGSFLYDNHPLMPGISPDGRRLYLLPMSENALYIGDLTASDGSLPLRRVAPVLPGAPGKRTDCRALDVDRRGRVLAVVKQSIKGFGDTHHLCRYDGKWTDLGVLYVRNPGFTEFKDALGKPKPWHHGFWTTPDGKLTPLHHHM